MTDRNMTALERAARAMCFADCQPVRSSPCPNCDGWEGCMEPLRAALRALRVPDEAMLKAMTRSLRSNLLDVFPAQAGKAWTGAIDSILAEQPTAGER